MNSLGNILYLCTLLHIICEHLHDLYTLNSLSGWKGLKKFIPRDSFNFSLYILFSMHVMCSLFKLRLSDKSIITWVFQDFTVFKHFLRGRINIKQPFMIKPYFANFWRFLNFKHFLDPEVCSHFFEIRFWPP